MATLGVTGGAGGADVLLPEVYARQQATLHEVRQQLRRRGDGELSLQTLARAFDITDRNDNGKLDPEEFEFLLNRCQIYLKKHEVTTLVKAFDTDGSGGIDFDEFLYTLRQNMNARRKRMVQRAFNVLDRDGSGELTVEDIKGRFNVQSVPAVKRGEMTEHEALSNFLSQFEGGKTATKDGRVTLEEFTDYYSHVSASFRSDDHFVALLENAWGCPEVDPSEADMARLAHELKEKLVSKTPDTARTDLAFAATFKKFDTDESGAVTADEFLKATWALGVPMEKKHLQPFFARFDTDGSGRVNYDEFVKALAGGLDGKEEDRRHGLKMGT
mmetsp:Transcript_12694/g.44458  ORF Transcript_12694/g.44458 Transcript_12694/m.44458 type:complete len:329 (-) Transcript_12694:108-1094(-)